jgi:hypothetical protein
MLRHGAILNGSDPQPRGPAVDVNSALVAVPAMLLALAIPVVAIVALLRMSLRRLSGRRGGHDHGLAAIARAGVQLSHLEAATPEVDDIAMPLPPRPDNRRHHRR